MSVLSVGVGAGLGSKNQGFTLIELLVVVGLISLVAMFTGRQWLTQLQEKQAQYIAGDIMTIAMAAQSFYIANGNWPVSLDKSDDNCNKLFEILNQRYFDQIDFRDKNDEELWRFDCSARKEAGRTLLSITRSTPNAEMQSYVARLLPMSEEENSDFGVTTYVVAPGFVNSPTLLHEEKIDNQAYFSGQNCPASFKPEVLAIAPTAYCINEIDRGLDKHLVGVRVVEKQDYGDKGGAGEYVVQVRSATSLGDDARWNASSAVCDGQTVQLSFLYRCVLDN